MRSRSRSCSRASSGPSGAVRVTRTRSRPSTLDPTTCVDTRSEVATSAFSRRARSWWGARPRRSEASSGSVTGSGSKVPSGYAGAGTCGWVPVVDAGAAVGATAGDAAEEAAVRAPAASSATTGRAGWRRDRIPTSSSWPGTRGSTSGAVRASAPRVTGPGRLPA
ncbi:hypothetical protein [Ornithinimicrobium kibberense]|uniref:hypothetical protein n=1 Tax=Ornithinimicrobium kibberense TaxID=282060 RepID=UPI00361EB60B